MWVNYLRRFVALAGRVGLVSADVRKSDWAVMRTAIKEGQAAFVESRPADLPMGPGKSPLESTSPHRSQAH